MKTKTRASVEHAAYSQNIRIFEISSLRTSEDAEEGKNEGCYRAEKWEESAKTHVERLDWKN